MKQAYIYKLCASILKTVYFKSNLRGQGSQKVKLSIEVAGHLDNNDIHAMSLIIKSKEMILVTLKFE